MVCVFHQMLVQESASIQPGFRNLLFFDIGRHYNYAMQQQPDCGGDFVCLLPPVLDSAEWPTMQNPVEW